MTELTIGETVRVVALPPYLKTADPMPMLRPPNSIAVGDEGVVIARNPGDYWSVRFTKGAFLLERKYIESVANSTESEKTQSTTDRQNTEI
ncbi:MAG: DUF3148 domain-containing protein [Geitlerinemataceae cyanobacterium]